MPSTHYTASDGFTYTLDFEKEPTAGAIAEAQSGLESQLSERNRQAQETAAAGLERGRMATIGNTAGRSFIGPLASMTRGLGEMTDSPSLLRGAEQLQAGTNAYFPVNPEYEQEIPTKIVGSAAGLASGALPFLVPVAGEFLGPASLIPQTYDAGYQQAEAAGLPASDVRSMGATNALVQTPIMTAGGRVTRGLLTGGVHDLSPLRGLAVGTAEAGAIGGASRVGENLVAGPSGYNIDPNRSILDEVPQSAGYMAGGSALLGGIPALLRSLPPRTPAASTAPPATPAPPPGALTPEEIAAASPFFSTGVNPAELAAKAKAANAVSRSGAALTPEQIAIFNAIKGGATGEAPPVAADGTPIKAPDTDLIVQPDEVPAPVTPPPLQVGAALATGAKVEFQGQRGRLARGEGGQLLLNTPKGQVIVANNIADDATLSDAGIAPTQPNRTVALARANMRAVDAHPEGEKLHDAYDASVQAVEPTWLRATSEHPVLNELADLLDLGHSELAATGEKIEGNKVYERQIAQYPEARLKNAENIVVNTLDRIEGTDAPDWMKSAWSSPLEELWHGIQHIRNIKAKYGNAEKPGPPETVQDLQTPRGNDANRGGSPPDTGPDPAAVAQAKDQQVAGAVARAADVAAKVEAVAPATAEALRQKAEAKLQGHMTSQTSAPPPVVVTPAPPASVASPSTADTPTTPVQPPPVVASVPVPSDQPAASVLSPPAPASPSSEIPAPVTPSDVAPVAAPEPPVAPPVATSPSSAPETSAIQPAPSAPPQGSGVVPSPNASTPTGDVQPIRATRAQFIAAYSRAHPNENPDAAWEAEVAAGGVIPVDEQGREIAAVKSAPQIDAPRPSAPLRAITKRPFAKRLGFSKLTDQDLALSEADSAALTMEAASRTEALVKQYPDLRPFSVPIQEDIELRARRFIREKKGVEQPLPAEDAPVENESPITALRGVNDGGNRFSWKTVTDTAASEVRRSPEYRMHRRSRSTDAPIGQEGSPTLGETLSENQINPKQGAPDRSAAAIRDRAEARKQAVRDVHDIVDKFMQTQPEGVIREELEAALQKIELDIPLNEADKRIVAQLQTHVASTYGNPGATSQTRASSAPPETERTIPASENEGNDIGEQGVGGGNARPTGPGVAGEPEAGGDSARASAPIVASSPQGEKQALAEGDRIRQGRGKFLTVVEVGKRKVRVADDKGNSYVIPRAEAERARVDPNAKPRTFHGVPYAPSGQPDIIDHILDKDGGMLGSTKAADQALKRGEPSRIKDLYNGREGIEGIYSQLFNGSQTPDQMATHLRDEHNLGDGGVQTMYDLIRQAIKSRQSAAEEAERQKGLLKEQKVQEKQVNRFAADAGQPEKGDKTVNVNDLHIGQTVTVNGERLKVVAIDPDGTVELEDGLKYGKQELPEGATIYVEKVGRVPKPKAGAPVDDWDTGPEPQSEAPPEASAAPQNQTGLLAETAAPTGPLPKLRSGENQGDLLSSQTEDLTLVGERGIDYAAREAERKKAERDAAEAKEKQDREQTSMFEDKPDAAPASNLKPEHAEALDSAIKSSRASFDKLGVPLRENDDNGNRTLAATYDARGNVTFGVDRNALARTIESSDFLRDNADAVRDFIAKSVHEELLHATDLTQTRERWEAQGRKGSFQDFFDGEKRALLESIQQDIGSLSAKNRKLAEGALLDGWNLYHDPNQGETVKSAAEAAARVKQGGTGFSFGNVDHLMEFLGDHPEHAANYMAETLRQFVQLRANNAGLTTETGYLNIVAKLRKFVDGLLKRLRAVAADPKAFSPALSDAIARLESAQEGLSSPPRPPADGGSALQAPPVRTRAIPPGATAGEHEAERAFVKEVTGIDAPKPVDAPLELPSARAKIKAGAEEAKAAGGRLTQSVRELGQLKPLTDKDAALRELSYRKQLNDFYADQVTKGFQRAVPDLSAREAIAVYNDVGGDRGKLAAAAAKAKTPAQRERYERALKLTPDEQKVAGALRDFYKAKLDEGQAAGILGEGRENYINRIVKQPFFELARPDRAPTGSGSGGRFSKRFRFADERTFPTIADVEQSGRNLQTYDAAELAGIYAHELGRAQMTREFSDNLKVAKASDGRPLAAVRGEAPKLRPGATEAEINAAIASDRSDYVANEKLGILGSLALHPEAARDITNVLGSSSISKWLNEASANPFAALGKSTLRGFQKLQNITKATMFDLSPFHIVTEGVHATGHRVNPFGATERFDPTKPEHAEAARAGLMLVPDASGVNKFAEGLGGTGDSLVQKIPGIGHLAKGMSDFLFHSYIPSLKLKTFRAAMERNMERFKPLIDAGKYSRQDIAALTADQVNAGYGHLNYIALARNPTMQHVFRLAALAPDFLEARLRFGGQAIKGLAGNVGREQLAAMATLFFSQFILARLWNKEMDDDYHWDHPFDLIHKGRAYTLRSVPEDIYKAVTDTGKFLSGRESPAMRSGIQLLTGRNYRGERVTAGETLADTATGAIPISLRELPGLRNLSESQRNSTVKWWESVISAMGVHVGRVSPEMDVYASANKFKASKGIKEDTGVYPTSPLTPIKYALSDNDLDRARKEIRALAESGKSRAQIMQSLHASITHPFTGSQAMDREFASNLRGADRQAFAAAQRQRAMMLALARRLVGELPIRPLARLGN